MKTLEQVHLAPGVQSALAAYQATLQQTYGKYLDSIILYGSQARGDARPDSDIDLLILFKEQPVPPNELRKQLSLISYPVLLQHEQLITSLTATTQWYQQMLEPVFLNIQEEGVLLWTAVSPN